jgi:hypothetical protein
LSAFLCGRPRLIGVEAVELGGKIVNFIARADGAFSVCGLEVRDFIMCKLYQVCQKSAQCII